MRALPFLVVLCAGCPPATQEVDQPAANLDVSLVVLDTTASPSDGKLAVIAQFTYGGVVAELTGATVTCNGVALESSGIGYEARVPIVQVGGSYVFTHTRSGTTATATVLAAPRPKLTTPASGASVTRTKSLSLTYEADGGTGVRASASDGATGVVGLSQSDTGSYTGLDVTTLRPGAGTISIVRDVPGSTGGSGFKSVEGTVSVASLDLPVTWL